MLNSKRISKNRLETYFDTTDETLLGWWEFDQSSGDIVDLIGRAGDATIISSAEVIDSTIGSAARFSGSNYAETASPSTALQNAIKGAQNNGFAFSVWAKPYILNNTQAIASQVDGVGTGRSWLTFWEPGGIVGNEIASYLGGVATHSGVVPKLDQWYHCVVNYTPVAPGDTYGRLSVWVNGISTSNAGVELDIDEGQCNELRFAISKSGTTPFGGYLHQALVYGRALLDAEIEALYNKGVVQFQGGYGTVDTLDATSGYLGNSPWQVNTGTFKVSTDSINGNSVKVIECINAGVVYAKASELNMLDTEAAYGTWEFWLSKGVGNPRILFTATEIGDEGVAGQDGYCFNFNAAESARLRRTTAGVVSEIMYSKNAYIKEDTFYQVKVTRTPSGVFTCWIRGAELGDNYQMIPIDGGGGSNPVVDTNHTTGNYVVLDLDGGDKFSWGARNGDYSFTKNLTVR